jgi:hypothetical protein
MTFICHVRGRSPENPFSVQGKRRTEGSPDFA